MKRNKERERGYTYREEMLYSRDTESANGGGLEKLNKKTHLQAFVRRK